MLVEVGTQFCGQAFTDSAFTYLGLLARESFRSAISMMPAMPIHATARKNVVCFFIAYSPLSVTGIERDTDIPTAEYDRPHVIFTFKHNE